MKLKENRFLIFAAGAFLYCLILALIFRPVSWEAQGDSPAYIELAKQFLSISSSDIDLSGRQPLYSFFLAPFIRIFGENNFLFPVMYSQFLMVFLSALFIYRIFEKFNLSRNFPLIVSVLYLANLSTLFYAYNILSETLSLFIFVSIVWVFYCNSERQSLIQWALLGILSGLMVLARFNTLGIPIVVFGSLILVHFRNYGMSSLKKLAATLIVFSVAALFVLNLWALYNLKERGFYGIFPSSNAGERWAIPATITEKNRVEDQYKPVLDIFLNARRRFLEDNDSVSIKKGSMMESESLRKFYLSLKPSVNGYQVYKLAHQDLLTHFSLSNTPEDNAKLATLLKPFYNVITSQNKKELNRFRIYSLLNTFRAGNTILPGQGSVNLNVLPGIVIRIYKTVFFVIALITFLVSIFYFVLKIKGLRTQKYWFVLILILLMGYFPAVHVYANVIGDANRFKFPSEPIIFGLFIYYTYYMVNYLKRISKI